VDISAPEGSYRPAARDLIVETWSDTAPKTVSAVVGGASAASLPRVETKEFEKSERGWTLSDGLLRVKVGDSFQPMRFEIQH
jgi:hypothetical protein